MTFRQFALSLSDTEIEREIKKNLYLYTYGNLHQSYLHLVANQFCLVLEKHINPDIQ